MAKWTKVGADVSSDAARDEMLRINQAQRLYYERATGAAVSEINHPATNLWRRLRREIFRRLRAVDMTAEFQRIHAQWLGDRVSGRVLELGVGDGTALSPYLASHSRDYLAIDLSEVRLQRFRARLGLESATRIRTQAIDVLSPDFTEGDFDVIYAMAVLHHFRYPETILEILARKLAPHGVLVTHDAMQVWWPARLLRTAYRPFQTDKAWEYPFSDETLKAIRANFEVSAAQGFYGASKWAIIPGLFSKGLGDRFTRKWHAHDLASATRIDEIGSCLQVSLCLRPCGPRKQ